MWWRLAVIVSLVAGTGAAGVAAYRAGYKAGSAAVTVQWQQDSLRRAEAARKAQEAAQVELERQVAVHQEIEHGLEDRLAAAHTRGLDLARRLRIALDAARPRLPDPGPPAGQADGSGRVAGDPAEIGAALTEHLSACEQDAERLTELQRYWREVIR